MRLRHTARVPRPTPRLQCHQGAGLLRPRCVRKLWRFWWLVRKRARFQKELGRLHPPVPAPVRGAAVAGRPLQQPHVAQPALQGHVRLHDLCSPRFLSNPNETNADRPQLREIIDGLTGRSNYSFDDGLSINVFVKGSRQLVRDVTRSFLDPA